MTTTAAEQLANAAASFEVSAAAPREPYRGLEPFEFSDSGILTARETEIAQLVRLVIMYRGVLLYGESGSGKSSLVNAGLLPRLVQEGMWPHRVRVQAVAGAEFVLEPIRSSGTDADACLPSAFEGVGSDGRLVLAADDFADAVTAAANRGRILLVFDQFEELVTLFDKAADAQHGVVAAISALLRSPDVRVKMLFAFREDYLASLEPLLGEQPELIGQSVRLVPPPVEEAARIIRAPFDRFPDAFPRQLSVGLAERIAASFAKRSSSGRLNLSELQIVCARLWHEDDPEALVGEPDVEDLLEDFLGERLARFEGDTLDVAVALLTRLVTSSGTRNVVSRNDLLDDVVQETRCEREVAKQTLGRLVAEAGLVRDERRNSVTTYEIVSEFLVPRITQLKNERQAAEESKRALAEAEKKHEEERAESRRVRYRNLGLGAIALAAVFVTLAIWAVIQRNDANQAKSRATALALALASNRPLDTRPDVSLLLSLAAVKESAPSTPARSSMISALEQFRQSGVNEILDVPTDFTDAVYGAAFSPDGMLIVTASGDGTARVWDVATGTSLRMLQAGTDPVTGQVYPVISAAFSPDGKSIVTASTEGTARVWDVATGAALRSLRGHTDSVNGAAFSPDGKLIVTASSDGTARVWDVATGASLRILHAPTDPVTGAVYRVNGAAFSPDGKLIVTASTEGKARVWDVATGTILRTLRGHTDSVNGAAFSPDGKLIVTASSDRTARVWDVATGTILRTLRGHTDSVNGAAFGPDGRLIVTASGDGTARVWRAATGKRIHTFEGQGLLHTAAFRPPGGRQVVTAGSDGTARVWYLLLHRQLGQLLSLGRRPVLSVAFSPGGRGVVAASVGTARGVQLWDMRTHEQRGQPFTARSVTGVALSPDGATLAIASTDAKGGTTVQEGETMVQLWDVRAHEKRGLPFKARSVSGVALSSDGATLAITSADAKGDTGVQLWDVRNHEKRGRPFKVRSVSGVALAPDGATLAITGPDLDGNPVVRVWDVRAHQERGPPFRPGFVSGVALGPDGATLAIATADALGKPIVQLWDRTDAANPIRLGTPLQSGLVSSVVFSPDRTALATANVDGTVQLWAGILWGNIHELEVRVCSLIKNLRLSNRQWQLYAPNLAQPDLCKKGR